MPTGEGRPGLERAAATQVWTIVEMWECMSSGCQIFSLSGKSQNSGFLCELSCYLNVSLYS